MCFWKWTHLKRQCQPNASLSNLLLHIWLYPIWSLPRLLESEYYAFHQMWDFFSHFFKYFSCTGLSLLSCAPVCSNLNVKPFDPSPWESVLFSLLIFSSLYSSDWPIFIDLPPTSLIHFSTTLLSLSSEFFNFDYCMSKFYNVHLIVTLYFSADTPVFPLIQNHFHSFKYVNFDLRGHI